MPRPTTDTVTPTSGVPPSAVTWPEMVVLCPATVAGRASAVLMATPHQRDSDDSIECLLVNKKTEDARALTIANVCRAARSMPVTACSHRHNENCSNNADSHRWLTSIRNHDEIADDAT